jgi:hypothetical protein
LSAEGAVAAGLRRALLGLQGLTAAGLIAELLLTGHTESPPQLLPLGACGLSLGALAGLLTRAGQATLRVQRAVGGLCLLVGAFGVFEHLEHNFEFAAEIRPSASAVDLIGPALTGANPLLAPGAVAALGLLALAAAWRHPAGGG